MNTNRFLCTLWAISIATNVFAAPPQKKIVFAKKIEMIEIHDRFTIPARPSSKVEAWVVAEAPGLLSKLRARIGSEVKKGDVLVTIRHTDPSFRYNALDLRSPVDGTVAEVSTTEGTLLPEGARILKLVDPKQVRLTVELTPRQLALFRTGDKGLFTPSVGEAKEVRIVGIGPVLDPSTGTAPCELEFTERSSVDLATLGPIGKVEFLSNVHKGISVPEYAVQYDGKKPIVRTVADGKIKIVEVSLGAKREGDIEILKGLKEGDTLALRSNAFTADGEEVAVEK